MTNLVILVGRIARDPEARTTQGGTSITSISVVTDRPARKDGKTYKAEVKLMPGGKLKVTGCIAKPLCQSQTWTRVGD